mgnify:CR=1 FL=1
MEKIFVFCYVMKFETARLKVLIPEQIEYWYEHARTNFAGGPFQDRSGGMLTTSRRGFACGSSGR